MDRRSPRPFASMARGGSRHLAGSLPPAALFNLARAGAGFRKSRLSNGLLVSGAPPEPLPAAFPVRNGPGWSGIVRDGPASSAIAGAARHPV